MASVSIDFKAYSDPRFRLLGRLIKKTHLDAIGNVSGVWHFCVERNSDLIPKELIDALVEHDGFADAMVKADLAEDSGDCVRVKGTRGRIEWLARLRKNSERGGEVTRAKKLAIRQANEKPSGLPVASIWQGPDGSPSSSSLTSSLTLTSSSISSSDSSSTQKKELITAEVKPRRQASAPETGKTWEAFQGAYFDRYQTEYVRNATTNSQMAQFVRRLGVEEAPFVADFYLTHNDQKYLKSMHSVGMMLIDAEKLRTEWKTGNKVTSGRAQDLERMQNNHDAFMGARTKSGGPHGQ